MFGVDISIMLICDAADIVGYDRRRWGICNALSTFKKTPTV